MAAVNPNAKAPQHKMTWGEAHIRLEQAGLFNHFKKVYGIPRGGQYVAAMCPCPVESWQEADIIIDDIIDSGQTKERWEKLTGKPVVALVDKLSRPEDARLGFVIFPWEAAGEEKSGPTESVVRILQYLGEDPGREGLKETPARVVKAFYEMTEGFRKDPCECLARVFNLASDEMVILKGIRFTSLCEHHLLPFVGTASVGYLPDPTKLLGVSKLARLVEVFAKRLQTQEQLTNQIARSLVDAGLGIKGVGVVLKAHHQCMGCRGVRQPDATMITSALLGNFREPQIRAEFLELIR